jgi:alpha-N-arabinofuranosidase
MNRLAHQISVGLLTCAGLLSLSATAADFVATRFHESADPASAVLRVHAGERSPHPIPAFITGKFAEHLGFNIYNGMDAQILRNATFADYPFASGHSTPDGVVQFLWADEAVNVELRRAARRFGWPDGELGGLVTARADGLAAFWTRLGSRESVQVSPDTGPHGGRAQRVQVAAAGQGIAQWTWLPLHRTRRYEFTLLARAPRATTLNLTLTAEGQTAPAAMVTLPSVGNEWREVSTTLTLPDDLPADAPVRLALTSATPGQWVMAHAFLRPADHVNGADPDIIRLLKESRLPLLRWPGGNFVSGYHWADGVGPVETRPTKPNYAWGGVEPNTFGTDEFIAFCRAVGCAPMICVNAGDGTPAEAAAWIEYCNGATNTPMGARRAAQGHPEPYGVTCWEVGNELWGRWQFNWTTAAGYVDRYHAFAKAMLVADPTIHLMACGAPVLWGKAWNDTLIAGTAPGLPAITDHPLIGGDVSPTTDPLDVFRDFMAVPGVLEQKWSALRDDMAHAGIAEPRLAVTELQLFAHLGRAGDNASPVRLTRENLVGQGSITEALYDILIYHAAVRLAPFVELITHSAVVNHGGGLRKEHERVYANPCHFAQSAFAAFAGASPVATELSCAVEPAPRVLPDLRNAAPAASFSAVDALAALATDGSLLLSIVHRGTHGPIKLSVSLDDFASADRAEVRTLSAGVPWAANTLEQPEAVKPVDSTVAVRENRLELELPPYSVLRVRVPRAAP